MNALGSLSYENSSVLDKIFTFGITKLFINLFTHRHVIRRYISLSKQQTRHINDIIHRKRLFYINDSVLVAVEVLRIDDYPLVIVSAASVLQEIIQPFV